MTQHDIDCAVARATGESVGVIRRRGFSLVSARSPGREPDPSPSELHPYLDWDDVSAARNIALAARPTSRQAA